MKRSEFDVFYLLSLYDARYDADVTHILQLHCSHPSRPSHIPPPPSGIRDDAWVRFGEAGGAVCRRRRPAGVQERLHVLRLHPDAQLHVVRQAGGEYLLSALRGRL